MTYLHYSWPAPATVVGLLPAGLALRRGHGRVRGAVGDAHGPLLSGMLKNLCSDQGWRRGGFSRSTGAALLGLIAQLAAYFALVYALGHPDLAVAALTATLSSAFWALVLDENTLMTIMRRSAGSQSSDRFPGPGRQANRGANGAHLWRTRVLSG